MQAWKSVAWKKSAAVSPVSFPQFPIPAAIRAFGVIQVTKKNDRKTGRRKIKKMVEHFHFSKNSPGETGTSFCLKKEFEHRENGRKEIRTSGLYT